MAVKALEICVVGGGPVGSVFALMMHRIGYRVLLVDAGRSPEKVCGEGLLPAAWDVLSRHGLASSLERKAPITGLVYGHYRQGRLHRMEAPLSRPAFGVERPELCRGLQSVLEAEGVPVWRGGRFRELSWSGAGVEIMVDWQGERRTLAPRLLVGADGLHSSVRRQAGLDQPEQRRFARWGTRVYFREPIDRPAVEVTLGDGVESYLTPLGQGLHGLAFLWSPDHLGRPLPGQGPLWERLLARFPFAFRASLPVESFFGDQRALGPLQQPVRTPLHPGGRVVLLGDASGYLDALTGEGLCLGLKQAELLCGLLQQGRLDLYPRHYWWLKLRHRLVVNGLLRLLARPALRDRVFAALEHAPDLFRSLISVAVEEASPLRLVQPDLGRFLGHLVFPGPGRAA